MFRYMTFAPLMLLLIVSPALGQNWAEKMFSAKTHNFGVVPRNAKAEFIFEIENKYAVDIHISGVRTSCGCTTPSVLRPTLTTYEKGGIRAVYNTNRFQGKRGATITVTFDKPRYAEVQLRVDGSIRSDITAEPSGFDFGSINRGAEATRTIQLQYVGGRSDWKINEVQVSAPHVRCDVQEVGRRGGAVTFRLTAHLDGQAPVGYLNDAITLVTNDSLAPHMPLRLSGRVVPPVTVSPADLFLGVIEPGQQVSRKLVIIGQKPFKITEIKGAGEDFEFKLNDESRKVHIVPVTFTASEKTGKILKTIEVLTDLDQSTVQCTASAAVMQGVARQ